MPSAGTSFCSSSSQVRGREAERRAQALAAHHPRRRCRSAGPAGAPRPRRGPRPGRRGCASSRPAPSGSSSSGTASTAKPRARRARPGRRRRPRGPRPSAKSAPGHQRAPCRAAPMRCRSHELLGLERRQLAVERQHLDAVEPRRAASSSRFSRDRRERRPRRNDLPSTASGCGSKVTTTHAHARARRASSRACARMRWWPRCSAVEDADGDDVRSRSRLTRPLPRPPARSAAPARRPAGAARGDAEQVARRVHARRTSARPRRASAGRARRQRRRPRAGRATRGREVRRATSHGTARATRRPPPVVRRRSRRPPRGRAGCVPPRASSWRASGTAPADVARPDRARAAAPPGAAQVPSAAPQLVRQRAHVGAARAGHLELHAAARPGRRAPTPEAPHGDRPLGPLDLQAARAPAGTAARPPP